ncbi:hypothetical protein VPNG_03719 [Cytospora leucostoma]|uniref:Uncharacterized protein n=1 Tax=Cytospora leucostoma TaxID=1230097 RepID=A0A423XF42_9PEZI|nr:hypothetical protein VPNG_03719 [Cytospora leucostoma]
MAIAYYRDLDLCGEEFDIPAALMEYLFYELLPKLDADDRADASNFTNYEKGSTVKEITSHKGGIEVKEIRAQLAGLAGVD